MSRALAVLAAGCLAAACIDFSGAPCTTSASCPAGQTCQQGRCVAGTGTGGGGGTGQARQCEPCADPQDCGPGLSCGTRRCDGARACFPTDGGTCSQIGGVVCPKVLNFQPYAILDPATAGCLTDSDCSPGSACREKTKAGFGRCLQACDVDADCYILDLTLARIPGECVVYSGSDKRCYPACGSAADPVCGGLNSYCAQFASGNFGFCEVGCAPCVSTCSQNRYTCGTRFCDNKPGCFPPDGGGCGLIDLEACP